MGDRYLTTKEVDERLAANADYGKSAYPTTAGVKWRDRAVPLWLFLAAIALGVFGVLFSIGLTLHEAYDAQQAMGMPGGPPPFNGFFEAIHDMIARSAVVGAWLWGKPSVVGAWLWGFHLDAWLWG